MPKSKSSNGDPSIERRFFFHAEGHAFSGEFHRPIAVPIEAQASTSLSTIGGVAHARVDNFHIPRLVSFKRGVTHVSGSRQDDTTYTTSVTVTLEGLSVLDFLTADRVACRLTSEHRLDEVEGHIIALGSSYDNLRLGGYEVTVHFRHDLLLEAKTYSDLTALLAKDKKPDKISGVAPHGVALCSLAESIETKLPGVRKTGHILHVPHFGSISFAEVLATKGSRTLTLLGLKLGSPDGGSGSGGQGRINGQTWP